MLYRKVFRVLDEDGWTISEHETRDEAAMARRKMLDKDDIINLSERSLIKVKEVYIPAEEEK